MQNTNDKVMCLEISPDGKLPSPKTGPTGCLLSSTARIYEVPRETGFAGGNKGLFLVWISSLLQFPAMPTNSCGREQAAQKKLKW